MSVSYSRSSVALTGALVGLLATACGAPPADPADVARVPAGLMEALEAGRPVDVLVDLDDAPRLHPSLARAAAERAGLEAGERSGGAAADQAVAELRAEAFADLKAGVEADLPPGEHRVLHRYDHLPALHLQLSSRAALTRLLARAEVVRVHADLPHEPFLVQSLPLIGQPAAAAAGQTGAGTTVVVLDTGVNYKLAAFGSCTAPGVPAACRVSYAADLAPDDGALDDQGHGTNVSAIVAGVAPGAKLAVLDVFRTDGYAYSSDIIAGINWAVANRAARNIVAINMSLGGGAYSAACPSDAFAASIQAARTAGILTTVASGNNGYNTALASPACAPAAVSVGAVYDANVGGLRWSTCTDATTAADQVTCFSNSASFLTILAPGALIDAGGYLMGGTSQAAPHVAGALAVLRAANPAETADATLTRLLAAGPPVTDPRNGVKKPRLNLGGAVAAACAPRTGVATVAVPPGGSTSSLAVTAAAGCAWSASTAASWLSLSPASGSGSGTLTLVAAPNAGAARSALVQVGTAQVTVSQAADLTGPAGTIAIAGGLAATNALPVTLALSATDQNGVASMCLSNAATCTAWEAYATSKAWTLAAGASGARTVSAWFKDGRGNVSGPAKATILYDVVAPTGGAVKLTGASGQLTVAWSGFADALSKVASYKVVMAPGAPPASCATGALVYQGTALTAVQAGLTNGTVYGFRACAVDGAGNVSAGAVASAYPAPEYQAPVGTVTLSNLATRTTTLSVTLAIKATDASGVASMCLANAATCTAWEPYATSKAWSFGAGAKGLRVVSVWFRDVWGNTSAAPVKLSVTYALVEPGQGTFAAAGGAGE